MAEYAFDLGTKVRLKAHAKEKPEDIGTVIDRRKFSASMLNDYAVQYPNGTAWRLETELEEVKEMNNV